MAWFYAGHLVIGFLIGALTGMSKSPVVSGVLPLLLTFAGGSIVTLSMGEGREPQDFVLIGRQLVAFGVSTMIGVAVGIRLRSIGFDLPLTGSKVTRQ